ncbi:MAG: ABC transporter ATP-binding protein [Desulfocurvibacter africanus]
MPLTRANGSKVKTEAAVGHEGSATALPDSPASEAAFGRHLWRLVPFARPYTKRILTGLATNAMARLFDLLPLVLVGRVVDLITPGAGGVALAASEPHLFWVYGLAVLGGFLGLALCQSASDYALDSMAQMVRHDIRGRLYEHIQRLDVAFFEERQTGDIMSVVSSDVDTLENFFADVSTSIVRLVITFTGTYAVLFWLDWRLALLLLAPLPFAVAAVRFFAKRVQPRYRQARRAVAAINSIIENNLQGIGVIQAYTAEGPQAERVLAQSAEYRDAAIHAAAERARFLPLIYVLAGLSFGTLIALGGWLTFTDQGPSVGDFTSFILLAMRLVLPLFVFGMLINQIQRSEAAAQRIMELLDTEPAIRDRPNAKPLDERPSCVEFRDVRFDYKGREKIINGVGFALGKGRLIGVVGPTGAGKSTLVKLLLRYYEPDSGQILVDGLPLADLVLESFRRHVGYVSQDPFLFYGPVLDNIRLGSPEASDEDVRHAAEVAGADEFIQGLPQGYQTLVGERGLKLSGGQRQRISLARAILRDPAILLLDEATASVDTRTEEIIQRNMDRLRAGRMILAVAHRLSTVRNADEILVLVDGLVVERGKHEELVRKGGVYAGLWSVQSGEGAPVSSVAQIADREA